MTSPYAFHQYFLNAEDEKVIEYLKVFSERSRAEIEELERQTRGAPHLRAAQRALADDVTDAGPLPGRPGRCGRRGRGAVRAAGPARAQRANPGRSGRARSAASALPRTEQLPPIVDVLERSGVVPSKAAARRAIAEGGAYLNNVRVHDQEAVLTPRRPAARAVSSIVRRGKRTVGAVTVASR